MLIRNAEVAGEIVDVRIADERIAEVARGLPGEASLDAKGAALLPGLHDHHLHLLALAAALDSVPCGPPEVRTPADLRRALASATPQAGWIRGVGYHESVAGELDRRVLDVLAPGARVRVQHRSGALWCLSSAGVEALGLDAGADHDGLERDSGGRATGRLFGLDGWLRERLPARGTPDLCRVGALLAARGVTGATDATPTNGRAELERFATLPQNVLAMGPLASGAEGPHKIVLRERALPTPEALEDEVLSAHRAGRPVAIHCVTRAELVVAAAALHAAGSHAGDRIEHASVAPPELVALLAELPVTVVSQPNFLRERGDDYRRDVEPRDRPWLYRCRGFLEAGVALGGGTDAPFGAADPWLAMQAAVDRRSEAGIALAEAEALTPERAFALFASAPDAPGGPPRRVAPGARADLCLLDRPWKRARDRLDSADVAATVCGGAILHVRP